MIDITAWVPVLVALVGLVAWCSPVPPKVQDVGRMLVFIGLLWVVYTFMAERVHIGSR